MLPQLAGRQICILERRQSTSSLSVLYQPLEGKFGDKSICLASSGPRSRSGKLSNSVVIALFETRLSLAHILQPSTHFLTYFAIPGW